MSIPPPVNVPQAPAPPRAPGVAPAAAWRGGPLGNTMAVYTYLLDDLLKRKGVKLALKKRGKMDKVLRAVQRAAHLEEDEKASVAAEVEDIFDRIEEENERVADFADEDHSLERLNGFLVKLGLPEEPSKTKARKALKRVMINIYDLVDNNFRVFRTLEELREYTLERRLIFPRSLAKSAGMRDFLRLIF